MLPTGQQCYNALASDQCTVPGSRSGTVDVDSGIQPNQGYIVGNGYCLKFDQVSGEANQTDDAGRVEL